MKKITFFIGLLLFSYPVCQSQIIHVPGDQPTIQAAIDYAWNGDTILVDHGTYYENINFKGKAITVASHYIFDQNITHIALTRIDGSQPSNPDSNSLVYFISGEDSTSVLYGFTLQNGTGTFPDEYGDRSGGAVFGTKSGFKLVHNRIINNNIMNTETCSCGGGIIADSASNRTIVLRNNIISNNSVVASGYPAVGGGFYLEGQLIIQDNMISNNIAEASTYAWGGGFNLGAYSGIISNNEISNNEVSASHCWGGGVLIRAPYDYLNFTNNYVCKNHCEGYSGEGGGIYFELYQGTYNYFFGNNIILGNTADRGGGLFMIASAFTPLVNNIFQANEAIEFGGGIYVEECNAQDKHKPTPFRHSHNNDLQKDISKSLMPCQIINNTFIDNIAYINGGAGIGSNLSGEDLLIFNNIFYQNDGFDISTANPSSNTYVFYNDIDTLQITGSWTGNGNFYADPEFCSDSCHIPTWSPCLEAGTEYVELNGFIYYAPQNDFEGDPRPDIICGQVDVGADENDNCMGVSIPEFKPGIHLSVFPNPCADAARLRYLIHDICYLKSDLYMNDGRKICELVHKELSPGAYEIEVDMSNFPPGLYFIRSLINNHTTTHKLIKLKN